MPKFTRTNNGYNTEDVDQYIENLCKRYESKLAQQKDQVFSLQQRLHATANQLNNNIEKEKQVSQALMYAVEKADEIELGAKRLYDLEIKRMRLLYKHWNNLLTELKLRPYIANDELLRGLIDPLHETVLDVLEQNKRMDQIAEKTAGVKEKLKQQSTTNIKNILNQMDYSAPVQTKMELPPVAQNEQAKQEGVAKQSQFKPSKIQNVIPQHNKVQAQRKAVSKSLRDLRDAGQETGTYLNTDFEKQFEGSVYAKTITKKLGLNKKEKPFNYSYPAPNGSGFDFMDALNPKEELDDIMKEFDFFEGDK